MWPNNKVYSTTKQFWQTYSPDNPHSTHICQSKDRGCNAQLSMSNGTVLIIILIYFLMFYIQLNTQLLNNTKYNFITYLISSWNPHSRSLSASSKTKIRIDSTLRTWSAISCFMRPVVISKQNKKCHTCTWIPKHRFNGHFPSYSMLAGCSVNSTSLHILDLCIVLDRSKSFMSTLTSALQSMSSFEFHLIPSNSGFRNPGKYQKTAVTSKLIPNLIQFQFLVPLKIKYFIVAKAFTPSSNEFATL